MKVKIGKYINWIGPYQIADMIFFWVDKYAVDENVYKRWDYKAWDRFGDWLASTWVADVCEWVQSKRHRTEKVHIDNYDVWSMDHTLALIIKPMLIKLKEQKQGFGFIQDKDVPKHLRSTEPGAKDGVNEWEWDNNAEKRYEWFLDELIWTFTQLSDDEHDSKFYDHSESEKETDFNESIKKLKVDRKGLEAHEKRINNGLVLFGKYFRTLWD